MLTPRQSNLLDAIVAHQAAHRCSPSFDQMAAALGLKSKGDVYRLLVGLEARGFIRRLRKRARAIEVVKCADGTGTGTGRWAAFSDAELRTLLDGLRALPGTARPPYGDLIEAIMSRPALYRQIVDAESPL